MELRLPNPDRSITAYRLTGTPVPLERRSAAAFPRIAYAAAHVVADPLAVNDPWLAPAIDWDATLLAFTDRDKALAYRDQLARQLGLTDEVDLRGDDVSELVVVEVGVDA